MMATKNTCLVTPNISNCPIVVMSSPLLCYNILLDDLWIISTNLQFTPANSFVARSTFYGPTSHDHLEVCPIRLVASHDCHMI